jgi:hypothetical protein
MACCKSSSLSSASTTCINAVFQVYLDAKKKIKIDSVLGGRRLKGEKLVELELERMSETLKVSRILWYECYQI